eukprot:3844260-Lingulodinium_polyedra.AAC.1
MILRRVVDRAFSTASDAFARGRAFVVVGRASAPRPEGALKPTSLIRRASARFARRQMRSARRAA